MNLKSAESAINGAWLTGLVIGILTLIQTVVVLFLNGDQRGEAVVAFSFIAILFALSYGVWRKNKICAILLALYFASLFAWMTVSWLQSKIVPKGILFIFIPMLLCLNGVRGVFAYHRIKQSETESGREYVEQQ
jgi:hypothetical protein